MVGQDVRQIRLGQALECGEDRLERFVGKREDGEVGCIVGCLDEICGVDCSAEGSWVCGGGGVEDVQGECEDAVYDVDYAPSEVNTLTPN